MQAEVDMKCLQTNFGGCSLSGFGDFAPFQSDQISVPFRPWTIVHGGQKLTAYKIPCSIILNDVFV